MPINYVDGNEIRQTYLPQLSTTLDPALDMMCSYASRLIDRYCARHFYTTTGDETLTLDGPVVESRYFDPGVDIAAITTVEVAADSVAAASGTYTSIAAADYFLRPVSGTATRPHGWPARYIELAEDAAGTYANSSQPFMYFQPGINTVRLALRPGWNTTTVNSSNFPEEIRMVAVETAIRLWRTREQGFSNTLGVSEIGTAVIERVLSPHAREVLEHYKRPWA